MSNTEIIDTQLNEKQQKAACTLDGPVRIIAGAGAGKTRTLIARIANLIKQGTDPASVLAITFTNKAANEMQARVMKKLDARNTKSDPYVSTFHSLGVDILKEFGQAIDIPEHFTIIDQTKGRRIIKDAVSSEGLDTDEWSPKKLQSAISSYKSEGVTFADFESKTAETHFEEILQRVWRRYTKQLHAADGLDFDDLLIKPVALLETNEHVRTRLQQRWEYVHVDEYQDTNRLQYKLGQLLAEPEYNICVVGDSDQTIYTWRGAEIKNILDFETDFPDAETITLKQNYRSTKTILSAAHDIIAENEMREPKKLFTDNPDGEKIKLLVGYTAADEAGRICKQIQKLQKDTSLDDIAILYRTNFQSRVLEDALLERDIPYQLLGTRFFDRKEVRDALAYLRLAQNKKSRPDLYRIINTPKRGLGKKTQERMKQDRTDELSARRSQKIADFWEMIDDIQKAIESQPAARAVESMLTISGLQDALEASDDPDKQDRWENLQELVSIASRYDDVDPPAGINQLLEKAALQSQQDTLGSDEAGVRLMTIHAAKGLEFDYVFISGLEQGLFPQKRDGDSQADAEEERRLMYVALTRARKRVFLSYAQSRRIYGSKETQLPSDFIDDISDDLIEEEMDTVGNNSDVELLDIDF